MAKDLIPISFAASRARTTFGELPLPESIISKLSASLAFIVLLFTWWSNPLLTPKINPDTHAYVRLAKDFSAASYYAFKQKNFK